MGWAPSVALIGLESANEQGADEVESDGKNEGSNGGEVSCKQVVFATPAALLEDQLGKAAKAWDAATCPFDYCWEGCTGESGSFGDMPKLGASRLREAASKFNGNTAGTYDGFHVAHF